MPPGYGHLDGADSEDETFGLLAHTLVVHAGPKRAFEAEGRAVQQPVGEGHAEVVGGRDFDFRELGGAVRHVPIVTSVSDSVYRLGNFF